MQLAFTKRNSFLLTTDGRVFSWGTNTGCLGRDKGRGQENGEQQNNNETTTNAASSIKHNEESENTRENENLGEVMFTNSRGRAHIVMIATGSSHVLALDTAGNVYAWGSNTSGQLGIPAEEKKKNQANSNGQAQYQDDEE